MPAATPTPAAAGFSDFKLPTPLLRALTDLGYETPSPIQVETIPALLAGRDLVGQAQTGTGKTAAFALPILARLDLSAFGPQALVLTPTRELAIQVAEAFQRYAAHLRGFHVLPIYGGQGYGPQLSGLRRGPHVVIGTPGRVIDHLERGTLKLDKLVTLVLDEGDEMLRMGFIEDVEAVLAKAPPDRQVALFSATMPAPVRRIAQTHLRDPIEITIRSKTTTVADTRQRYLMVSGVHKLDVLTRILEVEPFDAMIVFARTKVATDELAQRLAARGFAAAPLNGDLAQAQRERTIARLKNGEVDILVATDVAARGLDVDRVSHVLNFDIPTDIGSYVHRIGRTGRAGRSGEAILFVTHRERHLLQAIERATRQSIELMAAPTVTDVNQRRINKFKERISEALASPDLDIFRQVVEQYADEYDVPAIEIAAALAKLAQGKKQLLEPVPQHEPDLGPRRDSRAPHKAEAFDRRRPDATGRDRRPAREAKPFERDRGEAPSERGIKSRPPHRSERGEPARSAAPSERAARPPRMADPGLAETPRRPAAARDEAPRRSETQRVEAPRRSDTQRGELPRRADNLRVEAPRRSDNLRVEAPRHADNLRVEAPRHSDNLRVEAPRRTPAARDAERPSRRESAEDIEMVRYRVAVGSSHGMKAGNLVGAIANEAGLDSQFIGRIDIRDDHTFVDLPVGMPRELVRHMRKVWVSGQQLKLTAVEDTAAPRERRPHRPHRDPETPPRERPHRPHRDPASPVPARAHHPASARPRPTGPRPATMGPRSKSMTPRSTSATPRPKHRPGAKPGRPTRPKR